MNSIDKDLEALEQKIIDTSALQMDYAHKQQLISIFIFAHKRLTMAKAQMLCQSHEVLEVGYIITANEDIKKDIEEEKESIYKLTHSIIKLNKPIDHILWQAHYCMVCESSLFSEYLINSPKYLNEKKKCVKGILNLLTFNEKTNPPTREKVVELVERAGDLVNTALPRGSQMPKNLRVWLYTEIYLPLLPQWQDKTEEERTSLLTSIPLNKIVKEIV